MHAKQWRQNANNNTNNSNKTNVNYHSKRKKTKQSGNNKRNNNCKWQRNQQVIKGGKWEDEWLGGRLACESHTQTHMQNSAIAFLNMPKCACICIFVIAVFVVALAFVVCCRSAWQQQKWNIPTDKFVHKKPCFSTI